MWSRTWRSWPTRSCRTTTALPCSTAQTWRRTRRRGRRREVGAAGGVAAARAACREWPQPAMQGRRPCCRLRRCYHPCLSHVFMLCRAALRCLPPWPLQAGSCTPKRCLPTSSPSCCRRRASLRGVPSARPSFRYPPTSRKRRSAAAAGGAAGPCGMAWLGACCFAARDLQAEQASSAAASK